jgi:hypothetical protein
MTESTVMLSAFYVLAHTITGATDLTLRAFTAGPHFAILRLNHGACIQDPLPSGGGWA